MLLVPIGFTHYSPKDSESGIKGYIVADSIEQAARYIDKVYAYGSIFIDNEAEEARKQLHDDEDADGSKGDEDTENEVEYDDDDEEAGLDSIYVDKEWWEKNPTKREEASRLGLTISEYGSVEGLKKNLHTWWEGNDWEEVSDLYYGATQWNWREAKEITDDEAAFLLKLGVATKT